MTKQRIFYWSGLAISVIGLVTLPQDLDSWIDIGGDLVEMVKANPLSGLAVPIGISLLVAANWQALKKFSLTQKRWETEAEMGEEIHKWVREAHYQLLDLTPQDVVLGQSESLTFGFLAKEPKTGRTVAILKVSPEPGIRLQGRLIPTDAANHRPTIERMTDEQKNAMLEDIGLELARTGLGFDAQDLLGIGITIAHGIIPNESMTSFQFIEHVSRVERAMFVVQMLVGRHVRLANTAVPVLTSTTAPDELVGTSSESMGQSSEARS